MDLEDIINPKSFQVIQDDIADATEIAIIAVNYKGIPVTKHSRCSEFCKIIRKNPIYSELCEKCDSRGGLEAARLQKPYIYICHAGLIDFAAPIIAGGHYVGAVMAGQVLIDEADKEKLEYIVNEKQSSLDLATQEDLAELFNALPTMTLDKVKAISRMMFHLSNYIVEEALLKTSINELNELKQESHQEILESNSSADSKGAEKDEETKVIEEEEILYEGNVILRPALEYIHHHYDENITLNKMASLCNISASYFSKLFTREIKDNFPSYVNQVRIKNAKELLQNSDIPIINISLDLGFTDCGYFIKVFKNLEGVTPAAYRKQIKRKNKYKHKK